jgi:hypothetical protein
MKSDRLQRLAQLGTGALLLLSFQGVFAPRAACAGCNHLVVSRFDLAVDFNRIDELGVARSVSVSADQMTRYLLAPDRPERPASCSGMSCSDHVPLPISTTLPQPRNIDQWVALGAPLVLEPEVAFNCSNELVPPGCSGYKSTIFHPPPR